MEFNGFMIGPEIKTLFNIKVGAVIAEHPVQLEGNVLRNLRPTMFQMFSRNIFQICSFVMFKCP